MMESYTKTAQALTKTGQKASEYIPEPMRQYWQSALQGKLLKVCFLQAQALWANVGPVVVVAGFGAATFYVWKGLHAMAVIVVDVSNRYVSWVLVVCSFPHPSF